MTTVAAIQMVSGPDVTGNLADARELLTVATDRGARLAVLPENFAFMGATDKDRIGIAESPGSGPIQDFLAGEAARLGIWLVGGTVPLAMPGAERPVSASIVFDPTGTAAGRYDKIHLFDVEIPETGDSYRESGSTTPGDTCVVVRTDVGRIGLSICYDLRFPELYRDMSELGVDLVTVPAAFTVPTGRAHWEVLLRARAIENLTAVIAAAQGGKHAAGRVTYGDTMIVDSWGNIVSRLSDGPGVVTANLDLEVQADRRLRFPALSHRRQYKTRS